MRAPYVSRPNSTTLGRKFCPSCGRWRYALDFSCQRRSTDGDCVALSSYCHVCLARRYAVRAATDAAFVARKRESNRIYMEGQRRAKGAQPRGVVYRLRSGNGYLDSRAPHWTQALDPEPLAAHVKQWLAAYDAVHGYGRHSGRAGGGHAALSRLAGVPERRIWGVLHGERCSRLTADRLACAIGLPLALVYGDAA